MNLGDDRSGRISWRWAVGSALTASFLVAAAALAIPSATASAPKAAPATTATTATTASGTGATNLFSGDEATFGSSVGKWVNVGNATLQWSRNSGVGGGGALVVTATGSPMALLSGSAANGGLTAATPGAAYSGSASAKVPSGTQQVEPLLAFYDSTGNSLNAVFGPSTSVGSAGWTQLAPVIAIAPAGTASVVLGFIDYGTSSGTVIDVDNAWMEKTSSAAPSVAGPLSTSGNTILDANGAPVTLRGVVLYGLEQPSTISQVTQQAVIEAKAWGANFVRLALGEQLWLSSNCDFSPSYQATVSQVVNWITSLGMVALLDLHFNTVNGCEAGAPHNMADEAQAPTFWQQVASQFASNPLVAFDLYNEPHDISDAVWLDGGQTTDVLNAQETYQAAGMQQLYDSVRSAGAQNLVFISGNNWASTVPATLVQGTNIVYAAHAYTCPDSAPPNCGDPTPYDPSTILNNFVGLSASSPVMVTEFGWPSQYDGTYNTNVISDAESHGWGWAAFAFEDTQNSTQWDLTSGWFNGQTAEPAPSGMPVLCGLLAPLAGYSPCTPPSFTTTTTTTTTTSPITRRAR